ARVSPRDHEELLLTGHLRESGRLIQDSRFGHAIKVKRWRNIQVACIHIQKMHEFISSTLKRGILLASNKFRQKV
ncbi:MAG TPA: hypothetical protein VFC41_10350, partial [Anaerovoracaceae bacterium]|nr:hypothetical protein [Anaerovoracaceae bacterium]